MSSAQRSISQEEILNDACDILKQLKKLMHRINDTSTLKKSSIYITTESVTQLEYLLECKNHYARTEPRNGPQRGHKK